MSASAELRSIQYLRAIAALMVVAHHARHYFPEGVAWTGFGSRGVDIFFVISGFVMAHSTDRQLDSSPRVERALQFARKRFVRVVPLYWIALLWTSKRDWLGSGISSDLARDFVFFPHFHAVYTEGIYPALVPGWTINYEIFFYTLFAATLIAGRRGRWILPCLLVALVLLGTLAPVQGSGSAPLLFYTHTVLLEFALGLAVHALWKRYPRALTMPTSATMAVVAAATLAIENGDRWRGLVDGVPAALLVWSTLRWAEKVESRALRVLGDASYSIYLFHLASFAFAAWVLRRAGIAEPNAASIAVVLAVHLCVASVAGLVVWRLLEQPMLHLLRRMTGLGPTSQLKLPGASSGV